MEATCHVTNLLEVYTEQPQGIHTANSFLTS